MSRFALAVALVVVAGPVRAGHGHERADQRRRETQELLHQILEGEMVQSAVSKILFLGTEAYAAESLIEVLERAKDLRQRQNIAFALAAFGAKGSERSLYNLLEEDDSLTRMTALQGLSRIKANAGPKVVSLLKDKNLGIRREAARVIGAGGNTAHAKVLLAAANDETEPEVRASILVAIGDLGDKRQARPLEGFLKGSSESTRLAAAQALCKLGAATGLAFVQKLMASEDRYQRRQAIALLQGTKAKDADKVLRPVLDGEDPVAAAMAARILYQGGDAKMLDWLVLASSKADGSAKLAYESELEALRLSDDQRRKILSKAGIKAPER